MYAQETSSRSGGRSSFKTVRKVNHGWYDGYVLIFKAVADLLRSGGNINLLDRFQRFRFTSRVQSREFNGYYSLAYDNSGTS